jgi:hypothetical protein
MTAQMNTFFDPDDSLRQLDEYLYYTKTEIDKLFAMGVPPWNVRQEGDIEKVTQGIVTSSKIKTVEDFISFCMRVYQKHIGKYTYEYIFNYSAHRWINKQSSDAFEKIILCHYRATKEPNKKNPDTDFWIDGLVPVDLKVTHWPIRWEGKRATTTDRRLKRCLNDPTELINWYYKEQSIGRWNWQNRLFIVCYDDHEKKHLQLKSDFSEMKRIIFNYLDGFNLNKWVRVDQQEVNGFVRTHNVYGRETQQVALSDVLWNYKEHTLDYTPRPSVGSFNGTQVAMF